MSITRAILFTLAYADVFAYPLTQEELITWIPYGDQFQKKDTIQTIKQLKKEKVIIKQKQYFTFPDHRSFIALRIKRNKEQKKKLRIAREMAHLLSFIPTIRCIGVTGGVSVGNADSIDDIDFLIIAQHGTVWITRMLATFFMECAGKRRRPGGGVVQDKICLNMYMSDRVLGIQRQNIYTGHEILQMIPLVSKNHCYEYFLSANVWVSYLFPHKWRIVWERRRRVVPSNPVSFFDGIGCFLLQWLEYPSKRIQLWYMRHRRTHEKIQHDMMQFHPRDAHVWVKRSLKERLRTYHISLLDKYFINF